MTTNPTSEQDSLHAALTRGIERALADLGVDLVDAQSATLTGPIIQELRNAGFPLPTDAEVTGISWWEAAKFYARDRNRWATEAGRQTGRAHKAEKHAEKAEARIKTLERLLDEARTGWENSDEAANTAQADLNQGRAIAAWQERAEKAETTFGEVARILVPRRELDAATARIEELEDQNRQLKSVLDLTNEDVTHYRQRAAKRDADLTEARKVAGDCEARAEKAEGVEWCLCTEVEHMRTDGCRTDISDQHRAEAEPTTVGVASMTNFQRRVAEAVQAAMSSTQLKIDGNALARAINTHNRHNDRR